MIWFIKVVKKSFNNGVIAIGQVYEVIITHLLDGYPIGLKNLEKLS